MTDTHHISTPTILVVEDDAFIALDLEDVLSAAGYDVIGPVACVDDALAILRDTKPDVALLDYNLGEETSIPIAHRLQAQDVPFLFLSGQTKSVVMCDQDIDRTVLPKPFQPETLVASIRTVAA